MQCARAEPVWVDQLRMQNDKCRDAADQPGVGPCPGYAAPERPDHQRAGKSRHHAAHADPDDEGNVGIHQRPGHHHAK